MSQTFLEPGQTEHRVWLSHCMPMTGEVLDLWDFIIFVPIPHTVKVIEYQDIPSGRSKRTDVFLKWLRLITQDFQALAVTGRFLFPAMFLWFPSWGMYNSWGNSKKIRGILKDGDSNLHYWAFFARQEAVPSGHFVTHRKLDQFQSFKFLHWMLRIQGSCCVFRVIWSQTFNFVQMNILVKEQL